MRTPKGSAHSVDIPSRSPALLLAGRALFDADGARRSGQSAMRVVVGVSVMSASYNLGYEVVEVSGVAQTLTLERIADSRRRSRALAAWTDLQTLRTVGRSVADGIGQEAIAHALGISQPAVSKLARRARAEGDIDSRTPREVILERAIGMIDTAAMLGELRTWAYAPGRFDDDTATEPELYVPGLRDQLEDAAVEGLLSRGEFEQLTGAG